MNLKPELFQAAAFVGCTHLAAEFLNNPTLKTLDGDPGAEAALAVAAALLPLASGAGGAAGTLTPSAPALVAGVGEAAATSTPLAPALVDERGAAGMSTPSAPPLVEGYGGLTGTLAAAVVGFLLGQHHTDKHRAHRGREAEAVVDVEVEEYEYLDDESRRREDDDEDEDGRRRSGDRRGSA